MVRLVALFALAGAGCGLGGLPSVELISPAPGESFVRDVIGEHGARVAAIPIEIDATGVDRVEVVAGSAIAGDGVLEVDRAGAVTVEARGLDAGGEVLASASVEVTISEPAIASCTEWLDLYGVSYELGPDAQGVAEPVTAATPLVGVEIRYNGSDTRREDLFGDCKLILALAESAGIVRRRGVVELVDIGVYNYRCIGGGTPPDCPNGVSQHAYATAIDIAGYTTGDGEYYSVNDHWVIDADGESTCSAPTETDRDAFLHEIICAQKAAGIWNIVLTPNYNAAHRNHFHVDLTPGSDFVGLWGDPAVDVGPDHH